MTEHHVAIVSSQLATPACDRIWTELLELRAGWRDQR
jgi:hypothetical protein